MLQNTIIPPIVTAVREGRIDEVVSLLEQGTDVNTTYRGYSLLELAFSNKDMLLMLIEKGADVNAGSGYSNLLYKAVYSNLHDVVEILLEHGAISSLTTDRIDYHPFAHAAGKAGVEIVQTFLKFGADIDVQTHYSLCSILDI